MCNEKRACFCDDGTSDLACAQPGGKCGGLANNFTAADERCLRVPGDGTTGDMPSVNWDKTDCEEEDVETGGGMWKAALLFAP